MTPETLARACADTMWSGDSASQALGMEIIQIAPGRATLAMTIVETMTNGHRTVHGGFIFSLADSAFAFACNTYGERTVAIHCSISFIRPGKLGDRLIATAHEVSRSGKAGIYDVRVTVEDAVIAEFRGHSLTTGGSLLGPQEKR